uniref:Sulfotransferase family protein n=1 Tax=Magnetococcus massalia (strain MO-1) TaxID=451514 RepID=A0A1S7LMG3_MAGMO|nr:Protein of unknown function [Candidatus Magnetococcus massalia]
MKAPYFKSTFYKHALAMDVKQHLGSLFDAFFKFTFVRNPWDWVVSNYCFNRGLHYPFVQGTGFPIVGSVPSQLKELTFEAWLPFWLQTFKPSQLCYLVDNQGNLLVDFIGRFENLEADMQQIAQRLNLPAPQLPRLEPSKARSDYRDYYSETTIEMVRDHFKREIALFDYHY